MEAPGSPYASSLDTAPKRAPRSSPPAPQDRPDADHDPAAEHEGNYLTTRPSENAAPRPHGLFSSPTCCAPPRTNAGDGSARSGPRAPPRARDLRARVDAVVAAGSNGCGRSRLTRDHSFMLNPFVLRLTVLLRPVGRPPRCSARGDLVQGISLCGIHQIMHLSGEKVKASLLASLLNNLIDESANKDALLADWLRLLADKGMEDLTLFNPCSFAGFPVQLPPSILCYGASLRRFYLGVWLLPSISALPSSPDVFPHLKELGICAGVTQDRDLDYVLACSPKLKILALIATYCISLTASASAGTASVAFSSGIPFWTGSAPWPPPTCSASSSTAPTALGLEGLSGSR
ncbi:hypothetical protein ZWY2020_015644 [Hordeum vulgare]|nr:hypothetical protein ZWY2020_015644 [Hordeum vulgare]